MLASTANSLRRPGWCESFLALLARLGRPHPAARSSGVAPASAYSYRENHPDFARAWDAAISAAGLPPRSDHPIARERIARGWSQDHLASLLGVFRTAVSQWEQRKCVPEHWRFEKIAHVFGVTELEVEDWFYAWGRDEIAEIERAREAAAVQSAAEGYLGIR